MAETPDRLDPRRPATFPRRVLLMVTGLSPQVVTETVYALAVQADPPWIPTEIHLLTTRGGAERAELALLPSGRDWFGRLVADYDLPSIRFDSSTIHVVEDASGHPLEDIRSPEDNRHTADQITGWVQDLTADPETALHVSIAGGRKTMGYYLGYALSLFGRTQDRLSHVLVGAPFESCWDFFYPTPRSEIIETADKSLADARQAVVTLAEIPFVSYRHGLDERLLAGRISFSEAVDAARQVIGPPFLVVDLPGQRIRAAGQVLHLPPTELALLSVFARRALGGEPRLQAPAKGVPDEEWAERFLDEYRQIRAGELDDRERTEQALAKGMDGDYFSSHRSKLRNQLEKALGRVAAAPYRIDDGGCRPRRYGLVLSAEQIEYRRIDE